MEGQSKDLLHENIPSQEVVYSTEVNDQTVVGKISGVVSPTRQAAGVVVNCSQGKNSNGDGKVGSRILEEMGQSMKVEIVKPTCVDSGP